MFPKQIHEDFMETSYSSLKKMGSRVKEGEEIVEDDGQSGRPKNATADENVKGVHTLVICNRR